MVSMGSLKELTFPFSTLVMSTSFRLRGIEDGWTDGKHRFVIYQIAVVVIGIEFRFCLS